MKLVCYGDSLTAGFAVRRGYAYRLREWEGVSGMSVVVRGMNGRSARAMVDDFAADVAAERPDVVLVLAGLNDIVLEGASVAEVLDAYEGLRQRSQAAGITMVLGLNPVPGMCLDPSQTSWLPVGRRECERILALGDGAKAWAQERSMPVVDFPTELAKRFPQGYTQYFSDGVHPTDEVHDAMAEIVLAFFKPWRS